jgi:16S rRNA (adenine1518-N6/adenine1519-N6)-dimethyltransferase
MQDEENFFLKAKKSLGQHFLRSEKALNEMVGAVVGTNPIFEIGPGEGVLTEKLLEKGFTVTVIEIDKRSIEILERKFAKEIAAKKLFIIERDCLEIDYSKEWGGKYTLVGNIPYYITGAIFRKSFEQKVLPEQMIFLIQKEVAERIVARDKKESLLSVSIRIFSNQVKIVDIVKAGSFVPPPKVDSAIIAINNISSPFNNLDEQEVFFKILRASFSHKRKFLLTNLKTDLDKQVFDKYFEKINLIITKNNSLKARAEDVSIETWKEVIQII